MVVIENVRLTQDFLDLRDRILDWTALLMMFFNKFDVLVELEKAIAIVKLDKNLLLVFRHLFFGELINPF